MPVIIDKLINLENKELYLIFIDYSKAFDKMDHGRVFDIMLDMGIPRHLVEYIQLKEMSQDRAQRRRKISEWSSAVANPHRGRSTSE